MGPEPSIISRNWINAAWRADAECRLSNLYACLKIATGKAASDQAALARIEAARDQLKAVEEVLKHRPTLRQKWKGADIERAWVNLHEVQVVLVELTDPKELLGELPHVHALTERLLKPDNPERVQIKKLVESSAAPDPIDREVIAKAMRAAHRARAEQQRRLRSFRNTLLAAAAVLIMFALVVGVVGLFSPASVSLCFDRGACPTGSSTPAGGDMFTVELLGVFGAMIVGALAIRRMQGTSTPYAVPLASLLVKLPTGALTAVGGILLLKAGFVAGVSNLSTGAIEAYAFLFGASQQAVTHLVDQQTQTILNNVGTPGRDAAPATAG